MLNIPQIITALATGVFIGWLTNEDKEMIDCSKEIISFYNNKVALPEKVKSEMRTRKDINRGRLKKGLKDSDPRPVGMWTQGSYAMHTMVQSEDNDFDIDDGVYFKAEDLNLGTPKELTPYFAKSMVCDALKYSALKTPPEIKENCVRVNYTEGYHIDIPVYRIINQGENNEYYELASSSGWKKSDPRAVTRWFNKEVKDQSPDNTNGQQLRRIVRLLKDMVKKTLKPYEEKPSGFLISKLVTEVFEAHKDRDDKALYYTMKNIRDRLNDSLEVDHPIIVEKITSGPNDQAANVLKVQINTALETLEVIFNIKDKNKTLKAWGDVFIEHTHFTDESKNDDIGVKSNDQPHSSLWTKPNGSISPIDKKGGGRNA